MPRTAIVVVADLFFSTRIASIAKATGVEIVECAPAELPARCRAARPDVIVLDLHAAGDPLAAVRALKADPALAGIDVVGFYSHVDAATRRAALAAGVDRVLPRSAFTARLADVLAGAG